MGPPPRLARPPARLSALLVMATCVGMFLAPWSTAVGASGAREFDVPSGLAMDGGHLWVTNEAGNSVSEINPNSGAWIATFASSDYGFDRPSAITTFGTDLFVANSAGSVSELQSSDGSLVRVISGAQFAFADPVAIAIAGDTVLVLNAGHVVSPSIAGSITEFNALTGAWLRTVSGPRFSFDDPVAMVVSGGNTFVADKGSNSVSEVRIATGALVRVVARRGLDGPDGIAVAAGRVWVADSVTNAATEIAAGSGAVLATRTDAQGSYGFGAPSTVIATGRTIFVASPFGSSPMVTKLSALSGRPSWFMCNTNGPYYFSLLSAFAIDGNRLWVASRSGANSKTPGAQTGSLTELSTGSGALIMTLPTGTGPAATTSTTTSTTSTTTTTSPGVATTTTAPPG